MGRKPLTPEEKTAKEAAKATKKVAPEVKLETAETFQVGESKFGVMTFPEGKHPRTLRKVREQN